MANANSAADAIRRMAVQYQSMVEAADILDQIGSLDNATAEAKKRCADANAEADAARSSAESAKSSVITAKLEASDTLAKANNISDDIQSAAMSKANDIVVAARTQAEQIKADAQTVAEARVNGVSGQVDKLNAQKAALEADIADAQARSSAASALAEDAEVRLANIKAVIAKLAGA